MFAQQFDEFGPFGRGRGGFGPGGGGPFRAGRGMMEPAILSALSEKPMHGYEIISYLEEQSHGVWRPSPGSVYPTLQLLEEKGDVTSQDTDGKKVYTLTEAGRESAAEACERHRELWRKRTSSLRTHHRQFHKDGSDIRKFMHSIFSKGTDDQKAAASKALTEFKAQLEQISKGDF